MAWAQAVDMAESEMAEASRESGRRPSFVACHAEERRVLEDLHKGMFDCKLERSIVRLGAFAFILLFVSMVLFASLVSLSFVVLMAFVLMVLLFVVTVLLLVLLFILTVLLVEVIGTFAAGR